MLRIVFSLTLMLFATSVVSQIRVSSDGFSSDSLIVEIYNNKWAIKHSVEQGEDVFALAKRYHVPPARIADLNKINYQTRLSKGSIIRVPLGAYNRVIKNGAKRFDVRPLKYVVKKYDNLFRIAHMVGVKQKDIQAWNNMPDNYIEEGRALFVGWVMYNEVSLKKLNTKPELAKVDSVVKKKVVYQYDTIVTEVDGKMVLTIKKRPLDTLSKIERKFVNQIPEGETAIEEKGKAVFFDMKGKVSSKKDYYLAFHNKAKIGSLVKVHNPGTDKTIFVKVLGSIPDAKLYHNSVIGISSAAKEALMVEGDKAWCELSYAGVK